MTYKQTYDIVRTGSQITKGGKHVREDFLRQIQIRRNADLRSVSDMIVSHGTVCADIDSGGGLHKDWDLSQAAVDIWIWQVRSGGAYVFCGQYGREREISVPQQPFFFYIIRKSAGSWGYHGVLLRISLFVQYLFLCYTGTDQLKNRSIRGTV